MNEPSTGAASIALGDLGLATNRDAMSHVEGTAWRRQPEMFISVDVETSGPTPGRYSMLSIGACVVGHIEKQFYVELQPIGEGAVPAAMSVVGRPLEVFAQNGTPAADAMRRFAEWVATVTDGRRPVFVAFNAPFDWAFVNWYFYETLGENPFGFTAIDIKAYYMGMAGTTWANTSAHRIPAHLRGTQPHTHHALDDAIEQAQMFERMHRVAETEAEAARERRVSQPEAR